MVSVSESYQCVSLTRMGGTAALPFFCGKAASESLVKPGISPRGELSTNIMKRFCFPPTDPMRAANLATKGLR